MADKKVNKSAQRCGSVRVSTIKTEPKKKVKK